MSHSDYVQTSFLYVPRYLLSVRAVLTVALCVDSVFSRDRLIKGSRTIAAGLSHIAWLRFTISRKKGAPRKKSRKKKTLVVPRERVRQREGRHRTHACTHAHAVSYVSFVKQNVCLSKPGAKLFLLVFSSLEIDDCVHR